MRVSGGLLKFNSKAEKIMNSNNPPYDERVSALLPEQHW